MVLLIFLYCFSSFHFIHFHSNHHSLGAQTVKRLPTMRETGVQSLGEDLLEKEMVTHSSILAWKIPWTEEPARLESMGSQSRTQLNDFTFTFHSNHYYSLSFSCLGLVCSFLFPSALKIKLFILDLYSFLIQAFYNCEFPSKYYLSCISMFGMLHLHFHSSQTSLNFPCDFFFDSLFTSKYWPISTCL